MMNPLHLLWVIPAGVVGIRILLAILRLQWCGAPSPALARRIAATVLAARRAGHEAGDALVAMTWQVEMPWCWRLARAGRALAAGAAPCLAAALGTERLLPHPLAAVGAAAHRLGPAAEERWLAELAAERGDPRLAPIVGYALAVAAVIGAILAFVVVFILPKWRSIFVDTGVRFDQPVWLEWGVAGGCLALAFGLALAWAWWWWRWRALRRAAAGGLLAAATAAGVAEADIAAALVPGLSGRTALRVAAAGAAGDWPGLCAALGWRVRSPDALVSALAADGRRQARLATVLATGLRFAVPLILAIPVYAVVTLIFGTLVRILYVLGGA